jgi:hypothetical protein
VKNRKNDMTTTARYDDNGRLVVDLPHIKLVLAMVTSVVVVLVPIFGVFWQYAEHRFDERYVKRSEAVTFVVADDRYVPLAVFREFKEDFKAYTLRTDQKDEAFRRDVLNLLNKGAQ